jgi:uncharacterized protein YdaU (DUF1376 family)
MSERPWYKRYPSDAIHGMLSLTLEEKGAYTVVLDLIYDRQRGIADNPQYIAGVCGCSVRKWNTIRLALISKGKIYAQDGKIHNSRADSELIKTSRIARKRAENGAKGGYKSGETRRRLSENKDLQEANTPVRARVPETRIEKKDSQESPKKGTARASRLPADWLPNDDLRNWCKNELGWSDEHIDIVVQNFRDHWHDQGGERGRKLSWHGTWRNWCRREATPRLGRAQTKSMATVAQEMLQEKADEGNGRTDHGAGDGAVVDLADEDYGPARDQSHPDRLLGSS